MSDRITVAEAVGRTIARLGAAHIFGVVGSGNFHVTNAMIDHGVPFTAARHEMGAATMADAFSRTSGLLSVLSVHQGCGLTNALTGIAEAAKCHTPLLVVTGDTAEGDTTSNFYIDQDAAAASVGAVPARIHTAASAVADTAAAVHTAVHGGQRSSCRSRSISRKRSSTSTRPPSRSLASHRNRSPRRNRSRGSSSCSQQPTGRSSSADAGHGAPRASCGGWPRHPARFW